MWIHFDTEAQAVEHLRVSGWRKIKSGSWVSRDYTCKASIHPVHGEVVCVGFFEIA